MICIKNKTYVYGYTHAGVFHADDVFATALLKLIDPNFRIVRGYEPPTHPEALIYDIGEGEFDHHQANCEVRPSGVRYASFGLLWRELYPQLGLTDRQGKHLDNIFVSIIDNTDNTTKKDTVSSLIAGLNPKWDDQSDTKFDHQFNVAVDIAITMLQGQINQELSNARAAKEVMDVYEKSPSLVITFPQYIPYGILGNTLAHAVIYPSPRGGWAAASVNDFHGKRKWLFPEHLRLGAAANGLEPGLQFCHTGGFLAMFDTKEHAEECTKRLVKADMFEKIKQDLGNPPEPEITLLPSP